MGDLQRLTWPMPRLNEALEALARASGFPVRSINLPSPPNLIQQDSAAIARWMERAAETLGLEAESIYATYPRVDHLIRSAAPAIIRVPSDAPDTPPQVLLLLKGGKSTVTLLSPDRRQHRLPITTLRTTLCSAVEAPLTAEIDRMLHETAIPARRRSRVRAALLHQRLSDTEVGYGWLLRPSPGGSLWQHLRHDHVPEALWQFAGLHALQYLLWLLAWWTVGKGVLEGRLDQGWLIAWGLLLLTIIPLRLLSTWLQGMLTIGSGSILKQRLLFGTLRLTPEEIRHQGVGQLLGCVIESDVVQTLALNGGLLSLLAGIELAIIVTALAFGPGGLFHALLLIAWIGLTLLAGWDYRQQRLRWTDARLTMTHELIERMIGHRTRLAQEHPTAWHRGEDHLLASYLELCSQQNRREAVLPTALPRGWLIAGLLGLMPLLTLHTSPAMLALGVGETLLAYLSLQTLTHVLWNVVAASVAWQQVAPLVQAAQRPEEHGVATLALADIAATPEATTHHTILEAHDLTYCYSTRRIPVLRGCSLSITMGERILLEGASGSGKSTLAALLTGLRRTDSGLLLLDGLDRYSLGTASWRRRVVAAPQFHENHVVTGTFAFNLLMGRRWPPSPEDLDEAEMLCEELGLGDLLRRMPGGLFQMVGETGWQLSHGERSRLYIARALLQNARLMVLDESFAALDPENLHRALHCVLERAPALVVIAHP